MTQQPLLDRITDLLEREHDAIVSIDPDTLVQIEAERRELLSGLGPIDASDGPGFDSVEALRARNERAVEATLTRLSGALGRVGRGRTALAGYRPSSGSSILSRALDREV
jgi:hypothetical protein